MNRFLILLSVTTFFLSFTSVHAVTYSWVDQQGTVNFTEDPGSVPSKYRKKVRILDDAGSSPVTETKAPTTSTTVTDGIKNSTSGKTEVPATPEIGNKDYDRWKKEFADREAAMSAILKRTDEIAALVKNSSTTREEQKKLIEEHNNLLKQFNELKTQYNQRIQDAKKAGLKIDVQNQD